MAAIAIPGDHPASAQQPQPIQRKSLLRQDAPIPGHQAIMNIVEIAPGAREVRHTHPGPLFGYILEGTLTLEHEGRLTATYKEGDAFVVDAGKIHQGINTGTVPVKLLATLMVENGKPPTSPAQ
jgi:quercetin dioxygenase-like cupin family protein